MVINLCGAEFGSVGGAYGMDYFYPGIDDINYCASRGMDVIRLPFLWGRIQPTEDGPLDAAELAKIDHVVDYAISLGIRVVLDVHNYGWAHGSDALPNATFADLWGKLATHFKSNANVMFDRRGTRRHRRFQARRRQDRFNGDRRHQRQQRGADLSGLSLRHGQRDALRAQRRRHGGGRQHPGAGEHLECRGDS